MSTNFQQLMTEKGIWYHPTISLALSRNWVSSLHAGQRSGNSGRTRPERIVSYQREAGSIQMRISRRCAFASTCATSFDIGKLRLSATGFLMLHQYSDPDPHHPMPRMAARKALRRSRIRRMMSGRKGSKRYAARAMIMMPTFLDRSTSRNIIKISRLTS